jgi:ABC-type molybdenum transport system ATPase subunit/photorepair protein PhrA
LDTHSLFPVVSAFIERPAYQMSYGQRRSIELFRAMLLKPTALFLDEPFNYLDDAKAAAFINHIVSPEWHPVLLIITTHRHDTSLDAASEVFLFEGEPPFGNLSKQS